MNSELTFGTFNVPILTNKSLTASFTAPANIPKESLKNIISESAEKDQSTFDAVLKGVLSVPPVKTAKKK